MSSSTAETKTSAVNDDEVAVSLSHQEPAGTDSRRDTSGHGDNVALASQVPSPPPPPPISDDSTAAAPSSSSVSDATTTTTDEGDDTTTNNNNFFRNQSPRGIVRGTDARWTRWYQWVAVIFLTASRPHDTRTKGSPGGEVIKRYAGGECMLTR
jgi:hypothetical protein